LEDRIAALEGGVQYDANQQEVQRVQMECLQVLRDIKQSLIAGDAGATATAMTSSSTSSQQVEQLQLQIQELQKQAAKKDYRIEHLVHVVEGLLQERTKPVTSS
jgi:hypothetical protein